MKRRATKSAKRAAAERERRARALRRQWKHTKRTTTRERLSRALRRQWLTGALLQRGLWTVAQLADTLGVSKATCQRDLDLLAELFVVRTVKDPRHRQRCCYRMDVAFKPALGAWKQLKRRRPHKRPA